MHDIQWERPAQGSDWKGNQLHVHTVVDSSPPPCMPLQSLILIKLIAAVATGLENGWPQWPSLINHINIKTNVNLAEMQVTTTVDYATRWLTTTSWECSNYPQITPIMRETCAKIGIRYISLYLMPCSVTLKVIDAPPTSSRPQTKQGTYILELFWQN